MNGNARSWRPAISFSSALESATRGEIQQIKLRKAQRQVERLYALNEFYRRRLQNAGVEPDNIRTLDDLRRIPVVTKADFIEDQESHPPFGTRLGVPLHKVAMTHMTSGTSGQGQEIYGLTRSDIQLMVESSATMWMWAGLGPDEIGSSMVPLTNSAAGACMRPAIAMVGRYPVHTGHLAYGDRLDLFQRFGVHAIYGMPSYLNALDGLCDERGIDPREAFPDLRMFLLAGESYPIAWAERMSRKWGIELHETYGSTQTGGTCSAGTTAPGVIPGGERGRLYLFEWTVLYEVVDRATGEHVQPGEEGELIVTMLDREASPTLRFASGDRARWFPWNHEGSDGLPFDYLEAGTIGRFDDMLKIKGVNVWPAAVDEVVLAEDAIEEYRAIVTINDRGRTEVILQIAFRDTSVPSVRTNTMETLGRKLKGRTGISFSLEEVSRHALGGFEFKARRWEDRRHEVMKEANGD